MVVLSIVSSLVETQFSTIGFKVGSEDSGKRNHGQDPNPVGVGNYLFLSFFPFIFFIFFLDFGMHLHE